MKKIGILILGLFIFTSIHVDGTASATTFSDLNKNHRFYDEMIFLEKEGIISGYSDQTFRPDNKVTRAAAAIMIGRSLDLDGTQRTTKFSDVGVSQKASGYIASATEANIIQGFPNNTYRPDEFITRGQMAIFLSRAFNLVEESNSTFSDLSPSMKSYPYIKKIISVNITQGYHDGTFRPDGFITRSQFSAFLARALDDRFKPKPEQPAQAVHIPDSHLQQTLRELLNKPSGDITTKDLLTLTEFDLRKVDYEQTWKITNLTGLEHAKNVKRFDISGSKIQDLTPIGQLTNLEYLYLHGIDADLSPLGNLKNVKQLYLGWNHSISDISPLGKLTNLELLTLHANRITDISALANLTNLKALSLYDNQISDIRALAHLTKLEHLSIGGNNISNLSPLLNLPHLQELLAYPNPYHQHDIIQALEERVPKTVF